MPSNMDEPNCTATLRRWSFASPHGMKSPSFQIQSEPVNADVPILDLLEESLDWG
jgi:hypothetical protein